jgi:hypothetical protein
MRRLQLFELEDMPWCPAPIRDGGTDLLRFMLNMIDAYAPVASLLAEALRATQSRRVVDFCSGGGGPWRRMLAALAAGGVTCSVLLTDRFPNPGALAEIAADDLRSGRLAYHLEPVDVLAAPSNLDGFRTIFSAFHHFPPAAAAAILHSAVRHQAPIGVFEATQRDLASILATLFISPIFVLLVTPLIRPFRWSRLLFTYLIPAVPLLIAWDGVVSCLRSYTVDELRAIVATVPEADSYTWRVGQARGRGPVAVTYLIGMPRADIG